MKKIIKKYIKKDNTSFSTVVSELFNIVDNLDNLTFKQVDETITIPMHGNFICKGLSFQLSEISDKKLEVIFGHDNNQLQMSFYDEDENKLFINILPHSKSKVSLKTSLKENLPIIKEKLPNSDIFVHEFTHYIDWSSGNIDSFEPQSKFEYFNHKAEINAYINQGLFILLNEFGGEESVIEGFKYRYMFPDFMTALNEDNKKMVSQTLDLSEKLIKEEILI